jgi:hypothetical protein
MKKPVLLLFIIILISITVGCSGQNENIHELEPTPGLSSGADHTELTDTLTESYPIVDTGQTKTFGDLPGQDGDTIGHQPDYTDNGDGTITDNVTDLMWQKNFTKCTFSEAEQLAQSANTGGYDDWRVPTIKELYSLIDFSGNQGTAAPESNKAPQDAVPFINTDVFMFEYPADATSRYIDAQYISSTEYVSATMNHEDAFFGVNFADGRIKAYPKTRQNSLYYIRLVRGRTDYGINDFRDNNDGTISDLFTGLMWAQSDSGDDIFAPFLSTCRNDNGSMDWYEALGFASDVLYAGYNDWRLPNAKELQSLVDYTRSPDTTDSAAISQIFNCTPMTNEMGQKDYAYYWTSTSFEPGNDAVYIAFGRALGYMNDRFMDVHGAGSQKTDPKEGSASYGSGPQGDVRRVYNYVRLVRDITSDEKKTCQ